MRSKVIAPMKLKEIRSAVANYIGTEGCCCCEHSDHDLRRTELAKLLRVKKYPDGSGYDFSPHETKS